MTLIRPNSPPSKMQLVSSASVFLQAGIAMDLGKLLNAEVGFAVVPQHQVFLPQWTNDDWRKLMQLALPLPFSKGEVIASPNEEDDLYLVIEGSLKITSSGAGYELRKTGALIGKRNFLGRQPARQLIEAQNEGLMLVITRDGFEQFSESHPNLAQEFEVELVRLVDESVG